MTTTAPTTTVAAADGVPPPQRYRAAATIAIGVTMAVLDGGIANIALPTIARDFAVTPAASIWVVNAYQLTVTISLLPLSSLGDIVGYRYVFRAGLVLFVLASLGCAASHSLAMLSAARVLQGFGAAGIMSVNMALLRFVYPRARLGRGIGLNAMVTGTAAAAGPTIGAGILALAAWPWLFLINLPLGVVALGLARTLPRTAHAARRFDVASATLSAATFGLLIGGIEGLGHGQQVAVVAGELMTALAVGAALIARQAASPAPMLPVDLFKRPVFALSTATSICSFTAQGLAYVSLPFYFQNTISRSQVETGLLMTPWPIAAAIAGPVAGRLADRHAAGILGGLGLAALGAGLALLALLPAHPAVSDIAWRMALCGLGFGFFLSPNNRAIINDVPRERSGNASGTLSTARLVGQTTGAALVALIFGLTGAAHGALLPVAVGAGFAVAAAAASVLRLVEFTPPEAAGDA